MEIEQAVQALLDGKKLLISIGDKAEPYDRQGEQWVCVTSLYEGEKPIKTIMRMGTFAGLYGKQKFALDNAEDESEGGSGGAERARSAASQAGDDDGSEGTA